MCVLSSEVLLEAMRNWLTPSDFDSDEDGQLEIGRAIVGARQLERLLLEDECQRLVLVKFN